MQLCLYLSLEFFFLFFYFFGSGGGGGGGGGVCVLQNPELAILKYYLTFSLQGKLLLS